MKTKREKQQRNDHTTHALFYMAFFYKKFPVCLFFCMFVNAPLDQNHLITVPIQDNFKVLETIKQRNYVLEMISRISPTAVPGTMEFDRYVARYIRFCNGDSIILANLNSSLACLFSSNIDYPTRMSAYFSAIFVLQNMYKEVPAIASGIADAMLNSNRMMNMEILDRLHSALACLMHDMQYVFVLDYLTFKDIYSVDSMLEFNRYMASVMNTNVMYTMFYMCTANMLLYDPLSGLPTVRIADQHTESMSESAAASSSCQCEAYGEKTPGSSTYDTYQELDEIFINTDFVDSQKHDFMDQQERRVVGKNMIEQWAIEKLAEHFDMHADIIEAVLKILSNKEKRLLAGISDKALEEKLNPVRELSLSPADIKTLALRFSVEKKPIKPIGTDTFEDTDAAAEDLEFINQKPIDTLVAKLKYLNAYYI